jgi:hypothetical protein
VANPGPASHWNWNRSPFAIKSPCFSAAEPVVRAFAFGIDCFGSCSRAGGLESFARRRADEILRSQAKARNEVVSSTPHGAA